MGRPPLEIGTYGKIRFYKATGGWRACTKFRDFDGKTRPVERIGKTQGQAERTLKKALRERTRVESDAEITGSTKVKDLADEWFRQLELDVAQGGKSPSTITTYRSILDRQILPGLGEIRVREATVGRLDKFLGAVSDNVGSSTAKTARSALSGMLRLAARYGAIDINPTRDTRPITAQTVKQPRALGIQERQDWLTQLSSNEKAVRWELPELSKFMMGTGVRVGEALAVFWEDVDFETGVVDVGHTVVRIKGSGLYRKSKTKTKRSERILPLPSWTVDILRERLEAAKEMEDCSMDSPVFPSATGGLRDPNNVLRVLREARGSDDFGWVTSHTFRKTTATALDDANLPTRLISDQLGHSHVSMTQNHYLGRQAVDPRAAVALENLLGNESAE